MSHCPVEYIRHMLDEIKYIEQTKAETDKNSFIHDETLKRSFVRSIEIIGEAAKRLPNSFRQEHRDIAWQRIAGMRDKLIHAYFGIDYGLVWDVVEHSLPELKKQLMNILEGK
jgi:uncharacterized protein with HEPN domain